MAKVSLFSNPPVYCVDTCVIIDLIHPRKSTYPRDRFEPLWNAFEERVSDGRIISVEEVRDELLGDDEKELTDWTKGHRSTFLQSTPSQIDNLKKIMAKYPGFRDPRKDLADPAVVAMAASLGIIALSQEKRLPNDDPTETGKTKIPNMCNLFGTECVNILEFMNREGIKS